MFGRKRSMPPNGEEANGEAEASNNRKAKLTKSRKGCITCKKRRVKCDETKPYCQNCSKKNLMCGGYATNFKWRSFNDSSKESSSQGNSAKRLVETKGTKRSHSFTENADMPERKLNFEESENDKKDALIRHLELASLSVTGKSLDDIRMESELVSKGINPEAFNMLKKKRNSDASTQRRSSNLFQSIDNAFKNLPELSPIPRGLTRSNSFSSTLSTPEMNYRTQNAAMSRSFSYGTQTDVASIRREYQRVKRHDLQSLAEIAVDEIKASPQFSPLVPSEGADEESRRKSKSVESNDMCATAQRNNPALSDSNMSIASQKQIQSCPSYPKHRRILSKDSHIQEAQSVNDLSLTPSLSALINYAITNGEDNSRALNNNAFSHEGEMFSVPLSPLNLNLDMKDSLLNSAGTSPFGPEGIMEHTSRDTKVIRKGSNVGSPGTRSSNFRDSHSPVSPVQSPFAYILNSDSNQNLMKTSEREQILLLYSKYTCSIMSIKNGPKENPWRDVIIPLASNYSCLFNSIAAITLFHLAGNSSIVTSGESLRARAYVYMKKCILDLASGLSQANESTYENNSMKLPADIALATCLNLAVGESWDTHVKSVIAHLKGAKSMIQEVLNTLKSLQMISPEEKAGSSDESDNKSIVSEKLVLLDDLEIERINNESRSKEKESENCRPNISTMLVPKSLQFLFNVWIYFEVLSQMTADTKYDDKGIDLVATITTLLQSQHKQKEKNKGKPVIPQMGESADVDTSDLASDHSTASQLRIHEFFHSKYFSTGKSNFNIFENLEDFEFNDEYVDPLLGCAQSLFLIMGKVANLISKVKKLKEKDGGKLARSSLSTITTATQLKQQLLEWKPKISAIMLKNSYSGGLYENQGDAPTWDISSCIATAESYRYATLLYLHQAVPEIPSESSHQLAEKIFILLASIPTTSNTYIIHIFPLLVASCEAETSEEREWCVARWQLLMEKMWIGNIDRAFEVVKEVWRRKDEYIKNRQTINNSPPFKIIRNEEKESLKNISVQISGLMAAINGDDSVDDISGGINSRLHWSTVMKEWGWEVLLA